MKYARLKSRKEIEQYRAEETAKTLIITLESEVLAQ